MIRGVHISAGALGPAMRAQEILANNLANASAGAFRQDRIAFHRALGGLLPDASGDGTAPAEAQGGAGATAAGLAGGADVAAEAVSSAAPTVTARLDLGPGPLETTGGRLHLAVNGPGFFAVQGPEGELYTRDGSLRLGPDGDMLHRSGYPLLTEGGALRVPPGSEFTVAADGTVFLDGSPAGKLRLVALPDVAGLRHAGQGLLSSAVPGEADASSQVIQGALEGSNVDPVLAMVDMVALLREFEANQRSLLVQDGSLGRLISWAAG